LIKGKETPLLRPRELVSLTLSLCDLWVQTTQASSDQRLGQEIVLEHLSGGRYCSGFLFTLFYLFFILTLKVGIFIIERYIGN
jgi:hypothetical protein